MSFRCFLFCEEGEEEEGNGTLRGGKRTSRGWERTLKREETGLGEGRNNDFEEDENGTWRREKTGLGEGEKRESGIM